MFTVIVDFVSVGRGKTSWQEHYALRFNPTTSDGLDELAAICYRAVKGKLASRNPEVEVESDGTGIVSAGFHTVGRIEWRFAA